MNLLARIGLLIAAGLAATGLAVPARADVKAARQIMVMLRLAPQHLRSSGAYGGSYGEDASQGARRRIAVKIARTHGLVLADNWPMPTLGVDCFIMTLPENRNIDAAIEEVSADPAVDWSEPVQVYTAQAQPPNDPFFAAQPGARQWRLGDVYGHVTGRGVKVAVIDSAVDARHPDLVGQVEGWRNFVGRESKPEDHGTAVAGIIAARAGNGVGIAGVAPGARLLALRACWQTEAATLCDSLSLAKAVEFAVERKADIINMSLSGPSGRLLTTLLGMGLEHGAAIVAAADPKAADGGFPASLPGVIAVGNDAVPGRSRSVYLAPGRDIPAPQPGGKWSLVDGSSYSAAHVSGLLALAREARGPKAMLVPAAAGQGPIDICATLRLDNCSVAETRH